MVLATAGLTTVEAINPPSPVSAANVVCASGMTAQLGYVAVPSHGQVFYIDSGVSPKIDASYVGYKVTNTTGSTKSFWVSLESFTGGKVSLANPSDQFQQIQNLANGSTATAFFLLKASGATTTAQVHTVKIYETRPDTDGATPKLTCDYKFTKVAETIKAQANKIDLVTGSLSPLTATLGGTYTITIGSNNDQTQTGTLGAGSAPDYGTFWASPSAYSSWPTRALRLESTSIVIRCQSGTMTLTNDLYYSDGATGTSLKNCIKSGQGSPWTATYVFRIIGPAAAGLKPSPVANISSGTQYKHSDVAATQAANASTVVDLSGISGSAAASVTLAAAVSGTQPAAAANAVRIRYTGTVSTTSTTALQVDELVDIHDQGSARYVANTTQKQLGSASITNGPEPIELAADSALNPKPQHFIGPFTNIDSTHSQKIFYEFDVPCGVTNYKASLVAYTGDVIIGSASATASTIAVTTTGTCSNPTIVVGTTTLDPNAETYSASNVAANTATLNGVFNANGATTTYKYVYGTDPNLVRGNLNTTPVNLSNSTNTVAPTNITGLSASTTYYFQAQITVTSTGAVFKGSIFSFTTSAVVGTPIVRTDSASAVTSSAATLNGAVDPNGTAIDAVYFYYGTSSAMNSTNTTTLNTYTPLQVKIDDGAGTLTPLTWSANVWGETPINSNNGLTGAQAPTGLAAGTYYFQVHITCTYNATTNPSCPVSGFIDGKVLSFTTGAPQVNTQDATLTSESSATLNGTVNANGASTTANISFCYSDSNALSTTAIGKLNSCTAATGSPSSTTGNSTASSSAAISGLQHGTVYYFQVISTDGPGPRYTYGSVLSFKTLDITVPSSLTLASGTQDTFYQNSFDGVGGSGGYTWSTTSTLPPGLTLSSQGVISGIPSTPGIYTIVVTMTDTTTGGTSSETYTITINGKNAPVVAVDSPLRVTAGGAKIRGSVNPRQNRLNKVSFCYSLTEFSSFADCAADKENEPDGIDYTASWNGNSNSQAVEKLLSGLNPGTRYYYIVNAYSSTTNVAAVRYAAATGANRFGAASLKSSNAITSLFGLKFNIAANTPTVYSTSSSFTTAGAVTNDPSNLRSTAATINGTLTASSSGFGTTDVSSVYLCYSDTNAVNPTTGAFTSSNASCGSNLWAGTSVSANASVAYSRDLTGLTVGATYYTRIMTTFYDGSVANGAIKSWSGPLPPVATADPATLVTNNSATINGTVDAKNSALTDVSFCWDTTLAFTNCATNTILISAPSGGFTLSTNSISTGLTGLASNTTYYYRVMATNSAGSATSTYAQFTTKSAYTFNSDGGSAVPTQYFTAGDTISKPTDPTRAGYTFAGWYTASGTGGTAVTLPATNQVAGDVTIYAHWTAINYSVTYTLQGGTRDTSVNQTTSYLYGGSIIDPGTPTRTGYTFTGWYLDSVGTSNKISFTNGSYTPSPSGNIELFAQWSQDSYLVKYITGTTPSTSIADDSYVYGGSVVLPSAPSYPGYHFDGWFASLSDVVALPTTYSPPGTGTITLYAKWTVYTVSFSTGTGTGTAPADKTGVITLPDSTGMTAPTNSTFAGWACPAGTGTLAAGSTFTPASNVTCTAVWLGANSKTLTFQSNYPGGTPTAATSTQSASTSTQLVTVNFAKTGYTLTGWTITPAGGTASTYALTDSYDFVADGTAVAIWTQDSYTVTFDEQGGSNVSNTSYVYGGTYSLPTTTRAGYDFDGWYDDPTTGTLIVGPTGSLTTITPSGTGPITLYAHWTRTVYTVTFHSNYPGGTPTDTTTTQSANATTALRANTFIKNGYQFSKWSTSSAATGGTEYANQANYTFLSSLELYARWTPDTNSVIFKLQNGDPDGAGSYLTDGTIAAPTEPTRAGYTFSGWFLNSTGGTAVSMPYAPGTTGTFTLWAQWQPASHVVHFDSQRGTDAPTGTDTPDGSFITGGNIAAPTVTPTYSGREFLGWLAASGNVGTPVTFPYNPNVITNVTLYAQWRKWAVTFALGNGGGTPATGSAPADTEGIFNLPGQGNMIAPAGYQFTGWQCPSGTTTYVAGTSIIPQGTLICTAVWSLITSKTVTFHSNYPAGTNTTTVQTSSSAANLNPNPFIAGGFTFGGWATNPTGPKVYDNRDSFAFSSNTDLYAIWIAVPASSDPSVKIIYVYQGGKAGVEYTYYTIGAPAVILPDTTKQGYEFVGWSTSSIGPDLVGPLFTTTQNVTLYAIFKPTTVTITLNYLGGTEGVKTIKYTVDAAPVSLPGSKKDGFGFGGWSETKGGSYSVPNPYSTNRDITLYAIWNGTQYTVTLMPLSPAAPIKLKYTIGGPALTLPYQTQDNLEFMGWSPKQNATKGIGNKYRPIGDTTLWGVWKDIPATTKVYFGGDSPVINSKAKTVLKKLASIVLKARQRPQMIVYGWVKETVDTSYDQRLSNDRAVNTAAYLKKLGVDAVVSTTPKGISPENSPLSRRTDVSVFYSGKELKKKPA